jgi:hypothetical protein
MDTAYNVHIGEIICACKRLVTILKGTCYWETGDIWKYNNVKEDLKGVVWGCAN